MITKNNSYQFNTINEIIESIFGEEYSKLDEKSKFIKRYEMAYPISKFNKDIPVVHTKMGVLGEKYKVISGKFNVIDSFIIDDELSYILSLCKIDNILLLENINANIIVDSKYKTDIKDNYIVVNSYAKQIIRDKYIK